jgi:hypothetical protein
MYQVLLCTSTPAEMPLVACRQYLYSVSLACSVYKHTSWFRRVAHT